MCDNKEKVVMSVVKSGDKTKDSSNMLNQESRWKEGVGGSTHAD